MPVGRSDHPWVPRGLGNGIPISLDAIHLHHTRGEDGGCLFQDAGDADGSSGETVRQLAGHREGYPRERGGIFKQLRKGSPQGMRMFPEWKRKAFSPLAGVCTLDICAPDIETNPRLRDLARTGLVHLRGLGESQVGIRGGWHIRKRTIRNGDASRQGDANRQGGGREGKVWLILDILQRYHRKRIETNGMRTPLAWLNTTSSLPKLTLGASGIGFAVLLMFMQIGFLNGLFDSAVQVVRLLDADLILLSPARYTVPSEQRFDVKILDRIQPNPRVESVHPIYIDRAVSEIRVMGFGARSIRAIGVPTGAPIFIDPTMNEKCALLVQPDQILVDRKSKRKYGFEKRDLQKLQQQEVELSGKQARMMDWVEVGTDFVYDGTILLSERGVAHFFPTRNGFSPPLSAADLGLVKLRNRDRASIQAAREELTPLVGQGVQIMTKSELIAREIGFWARNTPIGAIFSIGTVMGLVVGVIICYQILFTDISDHLAEFATLKAMGYGSNYFLRFILAQSFYLSLFGFFPGWIASWLLYYGLSEWTGLVMRLTTGRIALVFFLTFVMCTFSGLLAVRKLWAADPASLFR